jgi:hypothetical protein
VRATSILLTAAIAVTICVSGCARAATPPPATITSWQEPTSTTAATTVAAAPVARGRLTVAEQKRLLGQVQLIGVGRGAYQGYVVVSFRAPVRLAESWRTGELYVVDEKSGRKYDSIPIMPLIGQLFSKPKHDGQPGYVMLENTGGEIRAGAVVTVVLGGFRKTHVHVE